LYGYVYIWRVTAELLAYCKIIAKGKISENFLAARVNRSYCLINPYGKIPFASPRSSVDRVSASGAEERSSSLRGGAQKKPLDGGFF
jgi:hypothetical protein